MTLEELKQLFETNLIETIKHSLTPIELLEPMVYSVVDGGKRLRPLLLLTTVSILDFESIQKALQTAVALEYIHTYSLIHDDLPAMDNDDLRRGKPTNHKQFGEATAILAGDALLTDSFGKIASDSWLDDTQKAKLVYQLSLAAGSMGMVAGQLKDIQSEGKVISLEELAQLHSLKTGQLFVFAIEAATTIVPCAPEVQRALLHFATVYGRAFQVHNDLMDVVSTPDKVGKTTQADSILDKATYPKLLGLDKAKETLLSLCEEASSSLAQASEYSGLDFAPLNQFVDQLRIEDM